jgi:hypothetical protein
MKRRDAMRASLLLAAAGLSGLTLPANAQTSPPARPPTSLCVRTNDPNLYNARAIGPHDIWIANAVGKQTPLRATTTCIHIRPDSTVTVRSSFQCLRQGDVLTIATAGMGAERCRVSKVTAFVPGSEAVGYR